MSEHNVVDAEGRKMSLAPTARHRRFLAQLARDHYLEGRSKVEIGKANGLSRFQVARLLQEAVDTGVVTITIEADAGEDTDLSEQVAAALGLRSVVIVDIPDQAEASQQMGRSALALVGRQARAGMRIGLSWSRTLDAAAAFTPALPRCTIVQLAGALRLESHRPSSEIFTRLGQDPAVSMVRLPAPLLVTEAETAADLRALPEISGTLAAADDLDLAVVSVASWAEGLSSVWEKCTPTQRQSGIDAGAVAEVSGRLFDAAGKDVTTIDDRVIAVSLDQLRRATTTVGVARGAERARAVRAACAAGILDIAVIDRALADAVLEDEAQPADGSSAEGQTVTEEADRLPPTAEEER